MHLELTSFGLCQPGVLLILSSFPPYNLWLGILRSAIPLLNHSFSSDKISTSNLNGIMD